MSVNDPALDSAPLSETQIYYFSRSRIAFATILFIAFTVVPPVVLAWFSLDPDWMPEQPNFSRWVGRGRRGAAGLFYALIFWAFFVLFMKLPFWVRIPFLLWSSYKFLRFFMLRGWRAFDRKPDFSISSEGISGWSGRTFHHVPWSEITKLDVRIHQSKFGSFDIDSPKRHLEFQGPETGPRRFFDTLPPKKIEIHYQQGLFPEKSENILRIVQKYRPDLVNEEDLFELA
ncbi:hypothetical protein AB4Y85_17275 [Microvirga sp. 2YAF29]|uniref:hypothetical protein n=1 Tax=Microvirga sp. 2YAF29 TaxID=3233031 RepID=UPI003F9BDE39